MSDYQPLYVFSRIPNDEQGKAFVDQMRQYFNRGRYKMKVRGSGLVEGESWKEHRYGAPIDKSTHLRVYIEEKKA